MTSALAFRSIPSPAPVRPLALVRECETEIDAYDATIEMAPDLLRDVILPSAVLASSDCPDVYRNMYCERIEELLGREYPATRAALGDELFTVVVREVLATKPASARALTRAGDRLPEFLAATRLLARDEAAKIAQLAARERVSLRPAWSQR